MVSSLSLYSTDGHGEVLRLSSFGINSRDLSFGHGEGRIMIGHGSAIQTCPSVASVQVLEVEH
jgi:hypothetical protein